LGWAGGRQATFRLAPAAPSTTPMMSDSFMISSSSPSILTSVPDHLPNRTRSPTLTSIGSSLPVSSRPPGPTAMTSPSIGFSLAVSGMMMPPVVFSSCSTRRITTLSCSGLNFMGCLLDYDDGLAQEERQIVAPKRTVRHVLGCRLDLAEMDCGLLRFVDALLH